MKRMKKQKVHVYISQEGVKTSRRLKTKKVSSRFELSHIQLMYVQSHVD